MRTFNIEQSDRTEPKRQESKKAAVSAMIGGSALVAAAAFGVLTIEAESPQDAIGSINIADRTYFITSDEMPFIALGVAGLSAVTLGAESLNRKKESSE